MSIDPEEVCRVMRNAPGKLLVIIGKPRAGKTRFALDIVASFPLTARPLAVLLFAPGSYKRTLIRRLKAIWSPDRLRSVPLFVDTAPRLWPIEIWLAVRRIDAVPHRPRERLGLIIANDLHRIGGRSYAQKVSDFKMIAREIGLPVIVLARPHPSLTAALRHERVASITLPRAQSRARKAVALTRRRRISD